VRGLLLLALVLSLGACHDGALHGLGAPCPCRSGYVCVDNDHCEHPDSGSVAPADAAADGVSAPAPAPDAAPPPSLAACRSVPIDENLPPEQRSLLYAAAFAPAAPVLALLTENDIRVWRAEGANLAATGMVLGAVDPDHRMTGVMLSPDGSLLATRGAVTVWRTASGAMELDFELTDSNREASWPLVALGPDNDRVAIAEAGGRLVTVWSASSHALLAKINVPAVMVAAASPVATPGSWWIAVGRVADSVLEVSLVDLDAPQPVVYPLATDVSENVAPLLALSADGNRLAIVGAGLEVWDVANKARPQRLFNGSSLKAGGTGVAFSPSGQHLAVTTDGQDSVEIWPLDGAPSRAVPAVDTGAVSPAFSADGTTLVALPGSADPFAFLYCRD
jgi:WD40 repeat protein